MAKIIASDDHFVDPRVVGGNTDGSRDSGRFFYVGISYRGVKYRLECYFPRFLKSNQNNDLFYFI